MTGVRKGGKGRFPVEISCGTVLYTCEGGDARYVLVRSADSCGFPKGHVEAGETEEQTALRETWEETCVRAEIAPGLRWETEYVMPSGVRKKAVYFLASFAGQTPAHNPAFEALDVFALPFAQALEALTYDDMKAILRLADAAVRGR